MKSKLRSIFKIPECAYPYIDLMLNKEEQAMIAAMRHSSFTPSEYAIVAGIHPDDAKNLVRKAYERCILNMVPETDNHYSIGNFYERLGAFCQYENPVWLRVERTQRDRINRWYLDTFIAMNKPKWESGERKDIVAPLPEALRYIEAYDGPITVRSCDCRNIFDNCGHQRETCISFYTGPNSSYHRGLARLISKEEAVQLVQDCEKDGLMHTLEGSFGMCNCCGDCCFDYLAAKECNTLGVWPETSTIALFYPDKCIACGICVKRCNLNAFTKTDKKITYHPDKCIGCGICTSTCPKSAIQIGNRS